MESEKTIGIVNDYETTQHKLKEIMGAMTEVLLYKNEKYGNSALEPVKVFSRFSGASVKNSLFTRMDDKLSRVKNRDCDMPYYNDVCDIIGYATLILVEMRITKEDILKLKD